MRRIDASSNPFRKSNRLLLSGLVLASLLLLLCGCNYDPLGLDNLVSEIEKTRRTIENQSIGWREELPKLKRFLDGMESKVSADAQGIVANTANQVQDITMQAIELSDAKAQGLIAQAGVEFRCNSEFVKSGVVAQLQYLADNLKFWKEHKEHLVKKPNHTVCWINPTVLSLYPNDNNWLIKTSSTSGKNIVHVYGYNFWSDTLPVLELQDASGQRLRTINVAPAYVTHYQIDLDFSSENFSGVKPGARVVFSWPDYHDPNTISLALNAPAELKLNNAVFSTVSPTVGKDPVTLRVTITNRGGSRSGDFVVIWQPDALENDVRSVSSLPLEPMQSRLVSFPTYTYHRDGQITSVIYLANGDDMLRVPLTVQPNIKPIQRFEYVEGYNVEAGMRACPKEYAMAGFHEGANTVLCRRVMPEGEKEHVEDVHDSGVVRSGMHACPPGTYMRGVYLAGNRYLCSYDKRRGVGNEWQQEFEDTSSNGYNMHICPRRDGHPTYMTGLHVGDNRFLCGVHYREDTP
jgi:hypothetical protein